MAERARPDCRRSAVCGPGVGLAVGSARGFASSGCLQSMSPPPPHGALIDGPGHAKPISGPHGLRDHAREETTPPPIIAPNVVTPRKRQGGQRRAAAPPLPPPPPPPFTSVSNGTPQILVTRQDATRLVLAHSVVVRVSVDSLRSRCSRGGFRGTYPAVVCVW